MEPDSLKFQMFNISFIIALMYLVMFLAVGIRVKIIGRKSYEPHAKVNMFSMWPPDINRFMGFILTSNPRDGVTKIMIIITRVLFVGFLITFLSFIFIGNSF